MKPVQNINRAWVIRLVKHHPEFKNGKPEFYQRSTYSTNGSVSQSWTTDAHSAIRFYSEDEAEKAMEGKFWVDVEAIEMTFKELETS
jgi:hypothetical protein